MNHKLPFSSRLWVAAGCALAFAAQADTGTQKASMAKTKAKPHWVQAASKHNGSGITMRYIVSASPQPGQVATVQLQFSGVMADDAVAELRAPEGSTLVGADGTTVSRVALPRGQTTTLALRLTPTADGEQTIDVFTTQAERSSAQSVPLKVGKGERVLKASGTAQTMPSGEKVISLPAQTK